MALPYGFPGDAGLMSPELCDHQSHSLSDTHVLFVVGFLNCINEQCASEKKTVAVVSFKLPRKIFGCVLGFPKSKLVHDLNLFSAYHNAVRPC